jgi:hypothetical protein
MSRTRRYVGQGLGISAQRHGEPIGQVGACSQLRLQQRARILADLLGLNRPDVPMQIQRGHQAHRAQRQLRRLLHFVIAQNADFQAAAAQIGDAARLAVGPERRKHSFPAKARLFDRADHLQLDSRFLSNPADEGLAVAGFPRSAGRHGAVVGHAKFIHHVAKMAKGLHGFLEYVFTEAVAYENALPQAQRIAFVV